MCSSLPSCSKLNETSKPIIKEYFAPNNISVKQEVYNFLKAAGRIQTATKSTLNLSDKEPNEGVWLMEAAINAERYGNLDKDNADIYSFEKIIENKLLSDGTIKMDAADMIIKYNSILVEIASQEGNDRIAKLIDFKTIDIDNDFTKINVEVVLGRLTQVTSLPIGTLELDIEEEPYNCLFDWDSTNYYTNNTNWMNDLNKPLIFPNGILTGGSTSYYITNSIAVPNYLLYINEFINQNIVQNSNVPLNNTGTTFYFDNLDTLYIPYTNIQFLTKDSLFNRGICPAFHKGGASYSNLPQLDNLLDRFLQLNNVIEATLPNSNFKQYKLVYQLSNETFDPHGFPVNYIERIAYLYESDN